MQRKTCPKSFLVPFDFWWHHKQFLYFYESHVPSYPSHSLIHNMKFGRMRTLSTLKEKSTYAFWLLHGWQSFYAYYPQESISVHIINTLFFIKYIHFIWSLKNHSHFTQKIIYLNNTPYKSFHILPTLPYSLIRTQIFCLPIFLQLFFFTPTSESAELKITLSHRIYQDSEWGWRLWRGIQERAAKQVSKDLSAKSFS